MNKTQFIIDNMELLEGDVVGVRKGQETYTVMPAVADCMIDYLQDRTDLNDVDYLNQLAAALNSRNTGHNIVDFETGKPLNELELDAVYDTMKELKE